MSQPPNEEEGALYSPRTKSDRYRNFNQEIPALGAEFPARGRNFHPPYKISAQNFCPLTEGCTTKDLAEFCRAGNYGISGNSGLEGRISGLGENISMKMVVTFASGLRRLHRNIIVQQRRMKPNDKMFDLAINMNR
jgi:hypothetical protein